MNYYSYQGRIHGQDRLNKFDEILQELLENDPSLFCEINYIGNCAVMLQRKFEIELSTENYENFITLRDYICFK
jgi:hypothetical protein